MLHNQISKTAATGLTGTDVEERLFRIAMLTPAMLATLRPDGGQVSTLGERLGSTGDLAGILARLRGAEPQR